MAAARHLLLRRLLRLVLLGRHPPSAVGWRRRGRTAAAASLRCGILTQVLPPALHAGAASSDTPAPRVCARVSLRARVNSVADQDGGEQYAHGADQHQGRQALALGRPTRILPHAPACRAGCCCGRRREQERAQGCSGPHGSARPRVPSSGQRGKRLRSAVRRHRVLHPHLLDSGPAPFSAAAAMQIVTASAQTGSWLTGRGGGAHGGGSHTHRSVQQRRPSLPTPSAMPHTGAVLMVRSVRAPGESSSFARRTPATTCTRELTPSVHAAPPCARCRTFSTCPSTPRRSAPKSRTSRCVLWWTPLRRPPSSSNCSPPT